MHQRRSSPETVGMAPSTPLGRKDSIKGKRKPPPSIKTLREAIPAQCFKPSTPLSLRYIARDIICVTALAYTATQISSIDSWYLRWILWATYGFVQGLFFTGLWILAHECGHGALFSNAVFNNVFGWSLHSFLLVPFYSWKYSHARHHRYTNHMEKDTAFVPAREGQPSLQETLERGLDLAEDTPILSLLMLLGHQLVGWPLYLLFEITAGPESSPRQDARKSWTRSHFDPLAGIYTADQAPYIFLSDFGLMAMAWALHLLARHIGSSTTVLLYVLPYLWVNHWLVAITYLHHTHPEVPHYESETWTFEKGALATVDRDFGWIGRHLFHGIIEFHVVHHLFSRIPFYHAEAATEAIKPLLGEHYKYQPASFWVTLWQTFVRCKYVVPSSDESGVLHWPMPTQDQVSTDVVSRSS